jgi:hypothetical protein
MLCFSFSKKNIGCYSLAKDLLVIFANTYFSRALQEPKNKNDGYLYKTLSTTCSQDSPPAKKIAGKTLPDISLFATKISFPIQILETIQYFPDYFFRVA